MTSREIIRKPGVDGWYWVGQSGSHIHFRHPTESGKATVSHPKHEMTGGTIRSIEKQTREKLR